MSHESSASSKTCAAYDVPMALNDALSETRGMEPERAKHRNRRRVQEYKRRTVGPMPVQSFFRQFMRFPDSDGSRPTMRSWKGAFRAVPPNASTPAEIYEPLIAALNNQTKHRSRCPGFMFRSTSARTISPRKLAHMKPHICCYKTSIVDTVENSPPTSRCDFGYAEMFIEVKSHPRHDFFVDPSQDATSKERSSHEFLSSSSDEEFTKRRDRALGQHIAYVTEIMARQHRSFLFSISMSGSHARLLRWDRAGCIVSESFDIRERPDLLCEFLWRFSHVDDVGRGHDGTVEAATEEEEEQFRAAISNHVQYQLGLQDDDPYLSVALSEHYLPGRVTVIPVLLQDAISTPANIHRIIVSRPVVSPLHLSGRGTRGFWGVDGRSGGVVFLKDTWRAYSELEYEGVTLQRMNGLGVRNIPSLVTHGDVPDCIPADEHQIPLNEFQVSVTDEYCSDEWACKVSGKHVAVTKYWHYRVVLGTVGYGLKQLKGTDELLHATYDAFHAMRDAFSKDSRLHRDISLGNIILVREPGRATRTGYLVDWEASCQVDESGKSLEVGRAGTWLFMSYNMLSLPGVDAPQRLQDDMESLLYVVLYCSYLWLPHNLSKEELADTIKVMFEWADWYIDCHEGGKGKVMNMRYRMYTKRVEFPPAMKEWLNTVLDMLEPVVDDKVSARDLWDNPDILDTFWGEFLRTHSLGKSDRTVHDHPHATGVHRGGPPYSSRNYTYYSTEAISLGKRSPDTRNVSPPPAKARRTCSSSLASGPPAPVPSRRSERLQRQRDKTSGPASDKLSANAAHVGARRPRTARVASKK